MNTDIDPPLPLVILIVCLLAFSCSKALPAEWAEVVHRYSLPAADGATFHASAVAVGDGYYLTVNHALRGAANLGAIGGQRVVQLLGRDPDVDLALVRVDGSTPALAVADQAAPGAAVYALGYGQDGRLNSAPGVIAGDTHLGRWLTTTAQTRQGDSGGAFVSAEGKLVGIIAARGPAHSMGPGLVQVQRWCGGGVCRPGVIFPHRRPVQIPATPPQQLPKPPAVLPWRDRSNYDLEALDKRVATLEGAVKGLLDRPQPQPVNTELIAQQIMQQMPAVDAINTDALAEDVLRKLRERLKVKVSGIAQE